MIDKQTVTQILDAADIVEVVSDFVHLRRRGTNYTGLCPFHNEKTPSFSVSRAKGICKCFSCGKGGSAVNFIMEHEQLSYYEALKYLAKKYHIEVKERELTDKEKETQSERESMLIINEFASNYFEKNIFEETEGREIGLSYFYERGFSDLTIKKFHLGYSLDSKDALYDAAVSKGYNPKFLFSTGLCSENKYGGGYDRFKGRVMFPVLNVAGKVIAFGGRTLKKDPAKYVNSPESLIYKKSNELYGLYQAKQAIVKREKCFLVEGYTDVISMHQAGIENVVASSGTSLTEGQIRMIHRFTDNVTVLYDGDAAGIKASLRGIDLLLAEGLNIKVLLLPDGDDPDSFARKHNSTEFHQYIDENETDFIQFKTRILLEGVKNDPIKRSSVIQDIVNSIAIIPFDVTQAVYVKECSRLLDISELVLINEVNKIRQKNKEKNFDKKRIANSVSTETSDDSTDPELLPHATPIIGNAHSDNDALLYPYEEAVIRYGVKYGMSLLCAESEEENEKGVIVLDYIMDELNHDGIQFSNPLFRRVFQLARTYIDSFNDSLKDKVSELKKWADNQLNIGIEEIKKNVQNIDDITRKEADLNERIQREVNQSIEEYRINYLERMLCSHQDDEIRMIALKLVSERYILSKIHTKYAVIPSEFNRLVSLLPIAIYNWKNCVVLCRIKDVQKRIGDTNDEKEIQMLLMDLQNLYSLRRQLAAILGDRVVNPKK